MNDTIYRRDAIQALVDTEEIKGFAYRILEDRLMEIPSADKPQGEWIIRPKGFGIEAKICSVCGTEKNSMSNYCPNCGARMFVKDINAPNKKKE